MATNVTWNGVSYSIPAAGEVNWPALSNFLIALGNGAAVAEEMKQAIRVATTSPVTVSATTDFAIVTALTVPAAVAVNLPAGIDGQLFVVLDGTGDASSNNITITPNGAETIGGGATLVLNHNGQGVILQYSATGTDWRVLVNNIKPGTIVSSDISGTIAIAQGGTGQATQTAAFDALAPTTTKGDLIASNGTDNIRVGVGTNGFALVADSGTSSGLNYAAVLSNPMDSAGDMIYGGASGVATKLDAGTSQQWLISGGAGAPTWGNTVTTGKTIDGTADEPQFKVQGHSTQTAFIMEVERSDATNLFVVSNVNGSQIRGTQTNDDVTDPYVGFYIEAGGASVTGLSSPTVANITSIDLTAGDWDLAGCINFDGNASSVISLLNWGISKTSATMPTNFGYPSSGEIAFALQNIVASGSTRDYTSGIPAIRVSLAATDTIYLVAAATFSAGAVGANGSLWARRVR